MNPTLMSMSVVQRLLHDPSPSRWFDQRMLLEDTGFSPDRLPAAKNDTRFRRLRQNKRLAHFLDWLVVSMGASRRAA